MQKNSSIVVSIGYGHNGTVAVLENGKITHCISEERFNRIKNSTGFPTLALEYIKKKINKPIDYYVMTQHYMWGYLYIKKNNFKSIPYRSHVGQVPRKPPLLKLFPKYFYSRAMKKMLTTTEGMERNTELKEEMEEYFSNLFEVPRDKIIYADHHLTHALSTKFFENNDKDKLVFTLDGQGDGLCATVGIFSKNDYKVISTVNKAFSLGFLYQEITAFLGMKPDEHEFKVMGLAPYAKQEHVLQLLPLFEKILWLNDKDEFESTIPITDIRYYLMENLLYKRFDNIAGAVQMFTENLTLEWIRRWIKKTGIKDISLSGGVFMNVKMNQKIGQMKEVNSLTITPSAGDESTVIGGCYLGYKQICDKNRIPCEIKPIKDLYLGTEYSEKEIEKFLNDGNYFKKYTISKPENINYSVAKLLSENQVVARFSGRMEFGARALGNRSILANPKSFENIRIINEMIKNRDFWMPFAASIIKEDTSRYLKNPKKVDGSFMIITFDTTDEAKKDLIGAIHPYDKTSRPQIVDKETNKTYHEVISEFKKITGIGGILNTSFNLHGEPNVESPKDAMHTFENSGLKYLALGPFLISK